MPKIGDVDLKIGLLEDGDAKAVVMYDLIFFGDEVTNSTTFKEYVTLWGDDLGHGNDDRRATVVDRTVQADESRKSRKPYRVVSRKALNEDRVAGQKDEIYAKVTIKGMDNKVLAERNSAIVKAAF